MPLQATSGAASYDAFGGGVPVIPNYIEEVFSTYLYTGNGSTQTITNGIDLSGKGGLVWIKNRNVAGRSHRLIDTVRGGANYLESNNTNAQGNYSGNITSFNSTGFSVGDASFVNESGGLQVSWTFRKQPKFFDIQTYTGNGLQNSKTIPHNLGSVPGAVIIKAFNAPDPADANQQWVMYHRSLPSLNFLRLNTTAATQESGQMFRQPPDATNIYVGDDNQVNISGVQYIAYIFAHDSGGFGLTGTDNVISCGSITGFAGRAELGYEPQWVLMKEVNFASNWLIYDNMRGWVVSQNGDSLLRPNTSGAEATGGDGPDFDATGFNFGQSGEKYIYIAIRRGPMKVPTSGTSVFSPIARTGTGSQTNVGGLSFSPDLLLVKNRGNTQLNWAFDKLRGGNQPLSSNSTDDEATNTSNYFGGSTVFTPNNTGFGISNAAQVNTTSGSYANWLFGRAPSFFDEVCYTGTGVNNRDINHNLTVIPELFIVKRRSGTAGSYGSIYDEWNVGLSSEPTWDLNLLDSQAKQTGNNMWGDVAPTSTTFRTGNSAFNNASGNTYVAYLFATCAGVSKVGSYTGSGALRTINCGFTGGARFVLIKRTDSAGNWFVWDTARGMVAGYSNDPSLALNTTAAERYSESVLTIATGFQLLASPEEAVNTNGASYIFLAIA
jgi:hypothetical protein